MQQLSGKLLFVLEQMQENKTPLELSLSGIELGSARSLILAKNLRSNHSLISLDMCRLGITDPDGVIFAKILHHNKFLRKLDLEGNLLGPQSASAFGQALK